MPAKPPFPLPEATTIVTDMLGALSSPESPGFSRYSVSPTTRLVSAQRLDRHGKEATEEEVQKGSFNARVVFRLKAEEAMLNQVGSMVSHPQAVSSSISVGQAEIDPTALTLGTDPISNHFVPFLLELSQHGGCVATIIDVLTSLAVSISSPPSPPLIRPMFPFHSDPF